MTVYSGEATPAAVVCESGAIATEAGAPEVVIETGVRSSAASTALLLLASMKTANSAVAPVGLVSTEIWAENSSVAVLEP